MVKYPDVALVIQGPLKDKLKHAFHYQLSYYKQLFDQIILSTYTEHVDDDIQQVCDQYDIKLVTQPEDIGNLNYKYNIGYQTVSTLEGLKNVTKKYALKHRTDECYSNLDKLIDLLLKDDEKWVSGTTIFGKKSYYLFHAADHLFCGKTEKLLKTFQLTKDNLEINVMERNYDGDPAAEVTFTKNFIRISGEEPDDTKYAEQMIRWFNFVPDKELHPFIIRFNHDNGVGSMYTEPNDGFHTTRGLTTVEQAVVS
jgi:hypothetical protein